MNKVLVSILAVVLFFNFVTICKSQQQPANGEELPFPGQLMRRVPEGNYLAPLTALEEREQQYLNSKQWRGFFFDMMAYANSYVGNYGEAIAYYDKGQEKEASEKIENSAFDGYHSVNALKVISSVAEKERVIMINELHHVPMHRAFTTELLPVLYKKGFRYLAVEAVNESDIELNKRSYPIYKTGGYTSEPVFGDLLRRALNLGFKVVPYEYKGKCQPKQENPYFCQNERERGQAQNIYDRISRDDPNAKILVHAGAGHIQEYQSKQITIMAAHFKNISGINPFTIDQMEMFERSAPEYEKTDYKYAVQKQSVKQPTIFQSAKGSFWVNKSGQFATVDAQIFHPRVLYQRNRPIWLKINGLRKAVKINTKRLKLESRNQIFTGKEPILIQAFFAGESNDAVPVDQIIIRPNQKFPAMMLPVKGVFRISAKDKTGRMIAEYQN